MNPVPCAGKGDFKLPAKQATIAYYHNPLRYVNDLRTAETLLTRFPR